MACSEPCASISSSSSEESNEPLVASSSSGQTSSCQVLNSGEPHGSISGDMAVVLPAQLTDQGSYPSGSGSAGSVRYSADDIRNMWNLRKIFSRLATTEQCVQFAEERNLIPKGKMCTYHKRPMSLRTTGNCQLGVYRCTKSKCRSKTVSRANGTWFENAHLSLRSIFEVKFMFSDGMSFQSVQLHTAKDDEPVLSTATISDWYSYCREAISVYEIENTAQGKLGGPGKIVQIDESKFGRRKYNRGRYIEGHWVLGMVENNNDDLRLEVCPDNARTAEVLVPLIQKHVEEGTEIHTDSWRAYDCLSQYGYIHKKVNHSDSENKFVAPDGTHTQRIESYWRNLKLQFHKNQYKGNFVDWIAEKKWRHKIMRNKLDPFEELLKVVAYVYKVE